MPPCCDPASSLPYQVFLIVDPAFGEAIEALLPHGPLWLRDLPVNRRAAEKFWKEHPGSDERHGLTTFISRGSSTGEEVLLSIFDTVDLHHGVYSHQPPYTVLTTYGTTLTEAIREMLEDYGFDHFESGDNRFRATRPLSLVPDRE